VNCGEVAFRLATYRDLDEYEQAEVQLHLHGCPSCQATFDAFTQQDQLLHSLPEMHLSRDFEEKAWARIHPRRGWAWAWQPVAAVLVVVLLIGLVGGTVYASSGAIPGDVLYPIKRINEQIKVGLTFGDVDRALLRDELAEQRREEALQVLFLGRRVRWQFEGVLESVGDASWVVGGLEVVFSGALPAPEGVQPGTQVWLDVESVGDQIRVLAVRIVHQPQPTATDDLFPVGRGSPTPSSQVATATPTPGPTWTPTVVGDGGSPAPPAGKPDTATPRTTPTRERTRPPGGDKHPTATPTRRMAPTRTPTSVPTSHPGTAVVTPPSRPSPWATARPTKPRPTRTRPWWKSTPTPTRPPRGTARPPKPTRTPRPTRPHPRTPPPGGTGPQPTPTPTKPTEWGPSPTTTSRAWESPLPTPPTALREGDYVGGDIRFVESRCTIANPDFMT